MSKTFITAKGTELPLLNLRGKDYLEVKYRLVWFREEHPTWGVETEFLEITERSSTCRAVIKDDSGRVVAVSHKQETAGNFPDFLEKSETGAIGRALALIGYGTQFAPEIEEGERIVDSPVSPKAPYRDLAPVTPISGTDPGSYVMKMGKKWKGMRLDKIDIYELNDFGRWLSEQADLKGIGKETLEKITAFLDSRDTSKKAK